VTIEDLDSKKGTLLNDAQIRGQKIALSQDVNEVKLGMCTKLVRYVSGSGPSELASPLTYPGLGQDTMAPRCS
jgi:hypothetical protein